MQSCRFILARMLWLAPVLLSTGIVSSSYAQYISDPLSAVAIGMGGAVRASSDDASALFANPAAMAYLGNYQASTDYRYFAADAAHQYQMTFIDNVSSRLASGLSYSWASAETLPDINSIAWHEVSEDPQNSRNYRARETRLGLAFPVKRLGVGATILWHRYKYSEDIDIKDAELDSLVTFNAGLLLSPTKSWRVALTGNHLLPTGRPDLPTTLALGLAASASNVAAAEIDVVADLTSRKDLEGGKLAGTESVLIGMNVGGRIMAGKMVPIRLGYYSEHRQSYFTCGSGFEFPYVRLNYGLRYSLGLDDIEASHRFWHSISLSVVLASPR